LTILYGEVSMRLPVLTAIFAILLLTTPSLYARLPAGVDFGVYCVNGKIALDQRCIEELKTRNGDDVCRLNQDLTEYGAVSKVEQLGGIGASCACP